MTGTPREWEPLLRAEDIDSTPVYPIIHMIRKDIIHFIDTPLSYEALTAPDLTYTLIRPLSDKYITIQREGNLSVTFCLLLNRVHFRRDQSLTTQTLSMTRAALCEILAIRVLRELGDDLLRLTLAATTSWPVYSGADQDIVMRVREERDDDMEDRVGNAIEMAIISRAKRFIKSTACQKVIDAIWVGKCVYQADSSHAFLSDTYKRNPIHFYNPYKAPLLDHYRLKVPAIRSVLEYMNFLVLFILFVVAIEFSDRDRINGVEIAFMVYSLGFSLEKAAAMQEHGIKVYFTGTWNGFDIAFVTIYLTYAIFRIYGVASDKLWARETGIDCLALIACLLFPRLAFVTLKNNLMVLSLRAMIVQFTVLMAIAAFCFLGFLYALWTLSRNEAGYTVSQISWWMLDIWFGLDATGFERASNFHRVFGPLLMVTYACLSNTLLVTVLVSILSHTFSTISEDAAAEAMFRRAVSTIEGVKADSLFSYQPPVNLIALLILLPAGYLLTPRWFHKVNVFMIRVTNFPILLLIAFYERQKRKLGSSGIVDTIAATTERFFDSLPRQLKRFTFFEGFSGEDDIGAVFELEEEIDSALSIGEVEEDTRDLEAPLPHTRVPSHGFPRPRTASSNGRAPPAPSSSPQKDKDRLQPAPAPAPAPLPVPRHRLQSIITQGMASAADHIQSPLAQLFQPLEMDPQVSYGPASRRRLSSMHQRPSADGTPGAPAGPGAALQRFPTRGSTKPAVPSGLSASPEEHRREEPETAEQTQEHRREEPETAEQTEAEESSAGGIAWARKMDDMEKRQKRIEAMVEDIARALGDK